MSTVALVPQPTRLVAKVFSPLSKRLRQGQLLVFVAALVTVRRHEIGVHRLVRQRQEKRFVAVLIAQPLQRVVGQLVGDVTLLRNALAVDVEPVVAVLRHLATRAVAVRPIRPLTLETHPVIVARLRVVDVAAHVPLADERRFVTSRLHVFREKNQPFRQRIVIVHHLMVVRVLAGDNAGAARRTK